MFIYYTRKESKFQALFTNKMRRMAFLFPKSLFPPCPLWLKNHHSPIHYSPKCNLLQLFQTFGNILYKFCTFSPNSRIPENCFLWPRTGDQSTKARIPALMIRSLFKRIPKYLRYQYHHPKAPRGQRACAAYCSDTVLLVCLRRTYFTFPRCGLRQHSQNHNSRLPPG